ncbi:MAG: flagellar hook-length control protein FliK [Candidatus Abyssobacteria bacterium SURF_5]|uniref:Flagellar hook-length control protein FliK n=1 Tax=Abyssobacteria bacterium (strain SURF_5) TaxID=2093360 RepID=A0A3A4N9J3_ABYX5|nr:MAG: flagellar hook-length control protein FliK [Candidatus Abyssubacteria bacterium SURF_5]
MAGILLSQLATLVQVGIKIPNTCLVEGAVAPEKNDSEPEITSFEAVFRKLSEKFAVPDLSFCPTNQSMTGNFPVKAGGGGAVGSAAASQVVVSGDFAEPGTPVFAFERAIPLQNPHAFVFEGTGTDMVRFFGPKQMNPDQQIGDVTANSSFDTQYPEAQIRSFSSYYQAPQMEQIDSNSASGETAEAAARGVVLPAVATVSAAPAEMEAHSLVIPLLQEYVEGQTGVSNENTGTQQPPTAPGAVVIAQQFSETSAVQPTAHIIDTDSLVEQIVQGARLVQHSGASELHVYLKPEFLGKLSIKVLSDLHGIRMEIRAENETVRQIMQDNLGDLQQRLANKGIALDHLALFSGSDSPPRRKSDQFLQAPPPVSVLEREGLVESMPAVAMPGRLSLLDYFA